MTVKCEIIPVKCIACGLCQVFAPEIFDYDTEGIVLFKQEPEASAQFIHESQHAAVLVAYKKCPVRAIILEQKNRV